MDRHRIPRTALATIAVACTVTANVSAIGPATATGMAARHAGTLAPGVQGPATYSVLLNAVDARTAKDVWAVGYTGDGATDSTPVAEHWNGKKWSLTKVPGVKGATSNQLYGVSAIAADDVWALGSSSIDGVGTFALAEHWDGHAWKVVASPNPPGSNTAGFQAASAASGNDVWGVGLTYDPGSGGYLTFSEHWNGHKWSVVSTDNPAGTSWAPLRGVAAVSAGDVWTVGEYQPASYATLAEHWDGDAWSVTDTPNPKQATVSSLFAVSADSAKDVWAAGCWSTAILFCGTAGSDQQPLVERWSGKAWKLVKVDLPKGQTVGGFDGVTASSAKDVWAVGTTSDGTTATPYLAHRTGGSWVSVGSPSLHDTAPYVGAVDADSTSDAWIVGATSTGGTLAEHWDGKKWSVVKTANP